MAGLLGHQKRHQEFSQKLFMSQARHMGVNENVAPTGFSRLCQVERLAGTVDF